MPNQGPEREGADNGDPPPGLQDQAVLHDLLDCQGTVFRSSETGRTTASSRKSRVLSGTDGAHYDDESRAELARQVER